MSLVSKQNENDDTPVTRRKKRKGPGGEISVPTEVTCETLKKSSPKKSSLGNTLLEKQLFHGNMRSLCLPKGTKLLKSSLKLKVERHIVKNYDTLCGPSTLFYKNTISKDHCMKCLDIIFPPSTSCMILNKLYSTC